ncbi:unnamed protein product [Callosobruchus maculatus]|uniref:Uncharacterized protein n=1 Tax=Callosobruchus maculatus TaxID=64391 RepID=A0A653D4D3_CALMS|nr:unnamed protein product [Callosobruchus maculatus]
MESSSCCSRRMQCCQNKQPNSCTAYPAETCQRNLYQNCCGDQCCGKGNNNKDCCKCCGTNCNKSCSTEDSNKKCSENCKCSGDPVNACCGVCGQNCVGCRCQMSQNSCGDNCKKCCGEQSRTCCNVGVKACCASGCCKDKGGRKCNSS